MGVIDFAELSKLALASVETLLSEFLPGGKMEGQEYSAKNPTRADGKPGSFKVNVSTGLWSDFATSDGGNDLISLVAYLKKCSQGEAAKTLSASLGVTPKQPQKSKVTASYLYHDENGSPILKVDRVEPGKSSKKDFYQYHREKGKWKPGANGNFLLYNLPDVLSAQSVIWVEGEGKAEVIKKFGLCGTCIPGGAKGELSKKIKAELDRLKGKDVFVLPDFDEPGQAFAVAVAGYLRGKAQSVKIVLLPDLQPKGDVKNWAAVPGNDKEKFLDVINTASEFKPEQPETAAAVPVPAGRAGKRPRQQDTALVLLDLAAELPLFHDDTETAWVYLNCETIPLESNKFESWLTLQHLNTFESIPGSDAINLAIRALKSRAIYESECVNLFNRVAWHDGSILVDLGKGRAQQLTAAGHKTIEAPPLFRRWSHQQPHPDPLQEGDPFDFLKFCRVADADRVTVLVALITAFVPGIAQPLWDISGPEGSGKSSFSRLAKRVVDPSAAELQIMQPERETDFFLLLLQNYMVCLDNQSSLSGRTSDLLCGAATGTAVSQRQHYSNIDTVLLRLKNIVLMNGINPDLVSRADLRDRAFRIPLDRIPDDERQEERILMSEFNKALPSILGGVFATLSKALAIYPTVKLEKLPRLADFFRYAVAVAEALGGHGERFMADYAASKNTQREEFLSLNSLATALLKHMDGKALWETTVGEAWETLFDVAYPPEVDSNGNKSGKSRDQRKPKSDVSFPGKPQDMRRYLERLKVTLSDSGLIFQLMPRSRNGVPIIFTRTDQDSTPEQQPEQQIDAPVAEVIDVFLDMDDIPL